MFCVIRVANNGAYKMTGGFTYSDSEAKTYTSIKAAVHGVSSTFKHYPSINVLTICAKNPQAHPQWKPLTINRPKKAHDVTL